MRERGKSALEMCDGLTDRRTSDGLGGGLPQARHRFLPVLALEGMVGEALDVFGPAIGVQTLDGVCDSRVQSPPPLLEEAGIGDVVGKGVLEGKFEVGEETRFIHQLRRL
jgi:hypothetical protein